MVNKKEKQEETKVEVPKSAPVYDSAAYSMHEGNGAYHVVEIPFNTVTMEVGPVRLVESNTEKLIIQERLQILLFNRDIL